MGTYISIPYVSRRSVRIEPSKPVLTVDAVTEPLVCEEASDANKVKEEEKEVKEVVKEEQKEEEVKEEKKEEPKEKPKEEPKEEQKEEEVKEEKKEEPKEDVKDTVVAEQVIPELLPRQLSINIPSESEVLPDPSEKVIVAPRIPEFQGNMNSASHAIKKFNRRHRKHLQN